MNHDRHTWLIAYDIRDPRRLRRVHRYMSRTGFALQFSLFAADLDAAGVERLIAEMQKRADETVDDVRLYALPENVRGAWLGPLPAADDVTIFGSPAAALAKRLRDNPLV